MERRHPGGDSRSPQHPPDSSVTPCLGPQPPRPKQRKGEIEPCRPIPPFHKSSNYPTNRECSELPELSQLLNFRLPRHLHHLDALDGDSFGKEDADIHAGGNRCTG